MAMQWHIEKVMQLHCMVNVPVPNCAIACAAMRSHFTISNGGGFARSRGFTVSLADAGATTTGVVLCSQVRTLDIEARQGRRLESIPREVMDDVLAKLATLVS